MYTNDNKALILIAIASYRDPDLLNTVENALANAKYSDRIRFAICYQDSITSETYQRLKNMDNVRKIVVSPFDSKGCGYARYLTQQLIDNEDYYLQIDSHMRFVKNWDVEMIQCLKECPSEKKLLSAYVLDVDDYDSYIDRWEKGDKSLDLGWHLTIGEYLPSKIYLLTYGGDMKESDGPAIGAVISGHFIFAPMSFVLEVPYDPAIYFWGEEISLSVRAWTHGWDIYNPQYSYCYHEYDRATDTESLSIDNSLRVTHWIDHLSDAFDTISLYHASDVIHGHSSSKLYGLGSARPLKDYCKLFNIDL